MTSPLTTPFLAFAARLRFPTLFWITAGIFVVDLIVPDFIPFADEILLGLATLILSNLQRTPQVPPAAERPVIDVEPPPPPK